MPTKPTVRDLQATSVEILNTIRNNASPQYKSTIPEAKNNVSSIREIGAIMMNYTPLQNEFLSALVNRIGRVIITSKMYDNPWSSFKKGLLEFGETVEEIFVNLAKPFQFDPQQAEETVWKREIPDVKAAFHTMNYQKFYKSTVSNDQLRTAFLSWSGITDLIAGIVDAMYTGANYDEFQTMKYMLARAILSGKIGSTTIPSISTDNMRSITSIIKGFSNQMEFMSSKRNYAGVMTYTPKNDQFIILNAKFQAELDVEVLAVSFNMDKAQFMGHLVLIDGFGELDTTRLSQLFKDDTSITIPSQADLLALNQIPAVMVSREWFMVFDNFYNFTELYNGEGLYWNYWYHVWKTFSISPFAEAQIFTPDTAEITSVTITPATVSLAAGSSMSFTANVSGKGFFDKRVSWSVPQGSISPEGVLTVPDNITGSLIVTAQSVANPAIQGTATVTVTST